MNDKRTAPELPSEVWSIIAGHMGWHRFWAKACGTNQSTFKVQLIHVKANPTSLPELRWVAKRWRCAQNIGLYCHARARNSLANGMLAELDASIACSSTASFGNLCQLGVSFDPGESDEWLYTILSRAVRLQLLEMTVVSGQSLPNMGRLKHLF